MKKFLAIGVIVACVLMNGFSQGTGEKGEAKKTQYPTNKVEFIIPYSTGGGTDALMRLLCSAMEQETSWGQSIIVSNKGGGLGQVGLTELNAAKPDGYTIGVLSNNDYTVLLLTGKNLSFGYDSFQYLCSINTTANVIMASKQAGFKTFGEMVSYAKANPGKLTVSISGKNMAVQVALIEREAGIKLTQVMQTSGGESLKTILGGHTDLAILDKKFVAQVAGQGINTLATFASQRIKAVIPDVPTLKECGYDIGTNETYRVIIAPKGTPKEICEKIVDTIKTVTDKQEFKDKMMKMDEIYLYRDTQLVNETLGNEYKQLQQLYVTSPELFK